jgi:hypothetical protein
MLRVGGNKTKGWNEKGLGMKKGVEREKRAGGQSDCAVCVVTAEKIMIPQYSFRRLHCTTMLAHAVV